MWLCYNSQSPDGTVINGYRLYIVYTGTGDDTVHADNRRLLSQYVAERARLVGSRGCQVTVASETDATTKDNGIRALNTAMMNAYIDDNVDYFHVVLPEARYSNGNKIR